MVVVSHLFFFFSDKFREGMTRYGSYPPCFGTIYFPTAPFFRLKRVWKIMNLMERFRHSAVTVRER